MTKPMPAGLKISQEGIIGDNTTKSLSQFADEQNFQGMVFISDKSGARHEVSRYEESVKDKPFATHSVSKAFTGVLVSEMIASGLISKDDLEKPVQLDEEVRKSLPEKVQERLKTTTLPDLMLHRSGLGDYLDRGQDFSQYGKFGYSKHVQDNLDARTPITPLSKPEDYLPFADPDLYDEEVKENGYFYSDLGILLEGLAAQHYYNRGKTEDRKKGFEEILREMVLEPAGIKKFSAAKPEDAVYSHDDPIAPHIYGSPACGYWTTLDDMERFGRHLCAKWQDPKFQVAVKEYGAEFYNSKSNSIEHHGGIPSSQTWFSTNLDSGIIVFSEDHSGKDSIKPDFGSDVSRGVRKGLEATMEYQQNLTKFDSWVEKLGLEKSEQQEKSFVERMQSDKTKGKSLGGANEL
jgi:hypothetical protein